jgi:hypothetical protein
MLTHRTDHFVTRSSSLSIKLLSPDWVRSVLWIAAGAAIAAAAILVTAAIGLPEDFIYMG